MNRFIPLFILSCTLTFLLYTIRYFNPYQAANSKGHPVPSTHIGIVISTLHKEVDIHTTNEQDEVDTTADNAPAVQNDFTEADTEETIVTDTTTETATDTTTETVTVTTTDTVTVTTTETATDSTKDTATDTTTDTATDTTTETATDTATDATTETVSDTFTDTTTEVATDTATTQAPATDTDDTEGCIEVTQSPSDICLSYPSDLVAAINTYRNSYGLASLSEDSQLNQAAGIRCRELISNMSHTRPDGSSCSTIYAELGIYPYNWGENLAGGHYTASETVTAWMNSEGHRANVLNSSFTKCGVAHISSSSGYRDYWVILFTD